MWQQKECMLTQLCLENGGYAEKRDGGGDGGDGFGGDIGYGDGGGDEYGCGGYGG